MRSPAKCIRTSPLCQRPQLSPPPPVAVIDPAIAGGANVTAPNSLLLASVPDPACDSCGYLWEGFCSSGAAFMLTLNANATMTTGPATADVPMVSEGRRGRARVPRAHHKHWGGRRTPPTHAPLASSRRRAQQTSARARAPCLLLLSKHLPPPHTATTSATDDRWVRRAPSRASSTSR